MDEGSSHVPEVMTVFFGANDACLPDRCAAFQQVPVDEYKHNLRSIVSYLKVLFLLSPYYVLAFLFLKRWPATHVILITPPPIDEDRRLQHPNVENLLGLPERTNEAAGAYARACIAVAEDCGILVVDLWNKMLEFPDWKKAYLRYPLHFLAYRREMVCISLGAETGLCFEEVIKKLRDADLSLETLKVDLPLIAAIDRNVPLEAFHKGDRP
ncbi:hypothetical protein RHMOL_Rhmol13G0246600 [Rhododendron molle]|uniref:Uncharacterized protein n=1 Tax=Rhododendron molle TaxID=49168 RepID=A0ACC0LBB9_RHOML|nr:hypothetical protein RHMOL_Rhmol13G0246600 [Rhododendron molle]